MAAALPLTSPAMRTIVRVPFAARLAVLWAAATAAAWRLPLNNDVSWQLWVARQLRHGAGFGREIAEVNPPLWFWEAEPISALADRLGIAADHLLIAAVTARTLIAVGLVAALVGTTARRWRLPIAGLAALLLVLPVFSFGERDHLAALAALPYAALIAQRAARRPVSPRLAIAVGLFAAWGFALKPYFAGVPLLLELWLAAVARPAWRLRRPEIAALVGAIVAYAAAVPIAAPDWLTGVVPLARAAYGAFAPPLAMLALRQPFLPAWLLGAAALALARPRDRETQAAMVTAAAFALSYLVQAKGFPYHALPLTICLGWALWLVVVADGPARRPLATLALAATLATTALIGPFRAPTLGAIDRALDRLPRGTVVAVLSSHSWNAFPMVERHGFTWPLSGEVALMPLPMILAHGEGPDATSTGRWVRRWTLDRLAADLARCPPAALVVDDPEQSPVLAGHHANYQGFAREDPRLAALLARFRPVAHDGGIRLLVNPRAPSRAPACFTPPDAG